MRIINIFDLIVYKLLKKYLFVELDVMHDQEVKFWRFVGATYDNCVRTDYRCPFGSFIFAFAESEIYFLRFFKRRPKNNEELSKWNKIEGGKIKVLTGSVPNGTNAERTGCVEVDNEQLLRSLRMSFCSFYLQ